MSNSLDKIELLQEISDLLKDEFIAKISKEENSILISFLNGQKFKLELTEI